MKKIIFLITILNFSFTFSQTQIGADINGEAANDFFGGNSALSADGSVLVSSANGNDGNGAEAGNVRVFQNISGTWTQIGLNINGEAAGDNFGYRVAISDDGTIIATSSIYNDANGTDSGFVKVYKNIAGTWTQIGAKIEGQALDNCGIGLSLSGDGNIIAVGYDREVGAGTSPGFVKIFQNISNVWTQIGSNINGEAAGDRFGMMVSLSSDGTVVAIGAPFNNGIGTDSGHIRVYQNISNVWTQIGTDINGEASGDQSGWGLSLSSNGNTVAIGARNNDGNGSNSGHARVYQNISNVWTQIGTDINGEASGDQSGYCVSLSADGTILAIGAPLNDGNGSNSGQVRIYQNILGIWTQVGTDINGEAAGDQCPYRVDLSSNGSKVSLGSFSNNGNGSFSGHLRVFELSSILSTDIFSSPIFSIYPNPTSNEININFNEFAAVSNLEIYDINGRLLQTETLKNLNNTINIENFQTGLYLFKINSANGSSVFKIQKK